MGIITSFCRMNRGVHGGCTGRAKPDQHCANADSVRWRGFSCSVPTVNAPALISPGHCQAFFRICQSGTLGKGAASYVQEWQFSLAPRAADDKLK